MSSHETGPSLIPEEMAIPEALPAALADTRLHATVKGDFQFTTHPRPSRRQRSETWERKETLGQGGYGTVWLERKVVEGGASDGSTQSELRAVKCIQIVGRGSGAKQHMRELEALAKFSRGKVPAASPRLFKCLFGHSDVLQQYSRLFVSFLGWYEQAGSLLIAMEYCEHGDLRRYLTEKGPLPEDEVQDIAFQVLEAIKLMHESGIANRDIKPAVRSY